MIKYIVRDILSAFHYLPFGMFAGILMAFAVSAVNDWRVKKGKKTISVAAVTCFAIYMAILLVITLFSRESGSSTNGIDLQLLSTWGINQRNNALVIENILLFIPYGCTMAWAIPATRMFHRNLFCGLMTSLLVEVVQLVTGRGFFQLDDIITNVMGQIIGFCLFTLVYALGRGVRKLFTKR